MSRIRRPLRAVFVVMLTLSLGTLGGTLGCSNDEPPVGEEQRALDMTPREALSERALAILNQKCTACHGAERFEARHFSPQEWERVIERMVAKGANLSGDEMDVLRHWREEP